jgi:hypothetical protein
MIYNFTKTAFIHVANEILINLFYPSFHMQPNVAVSISLLKFLQHLSYITAICGIKA